MGGEYNATLPDKHFENLSLIFRITSIIGLIQKTSPIVKTGRAKENGTNHLGKWNPKDAQNKKKSTETFIEFSFPRPISMLMVKLDFFQ